MMNNISFGSFVVVAKKDQYENFKQTELDMVRDRGVTRDCVVKFRFNNGNGCSMAGIWTDNKEAEADIKQHFLNNGFQDTLDIRKIDEAKIPSDNYGWAEQVLKMFGLDK